MNIDKRLLNVIYQSMNGDMPYHFEEILSQYTDKEILAAYEQAIKDSNVINSATENVAFSFEQILSAAKYQMNIRPLTSDCMSNANKFALLTEQMGYSAENVMFVIVVGDSMNGAGINNGDIVFVDTNVASVNDGDIVVANVDYRLYIKRYRLLAGEEWLYSSNPFYPPFRLSGTQFEIIGYCKNVIKQIY
jgi:SOS-response transcriptional repressor LexA